MSGWETNAENLRTFLKEVRPAGGLGNEAIEIGLWHANCETDQEDSDIAQVLNNRQCLIGGGLAT